MRIEEVPWLGDHRLVPDAVLPGAGYIAMAVKAASRIYNEFPSPLKIKSFSLRDVALKKSLVIPEDDLGVEVLTSMELVDGATTQSPAWATFSISSVGRETNQWSEQCTGGVKVEVGLADEDIEVGVEMKGEVEEHLLSPRARVDARACTPGTGNSPKSVSATARPLSDIHSNPASKLAVATVVLHTTIIKGGESPYPLHPASLDGAIQLSLIACHGGRPSEASTAFVPIQLSRLYLSNNNDTIAGDTCTVVG